MRVILRILLQSPASTAKLVEIALFERGVVVTLSANFRGKGVIHRRILASEN